MVNIDEAEASNLAKYLGKTREQVGKYAGEGQFPSGRF